MTVGQLWRRRRDLTLAMAAVHGASIRFLADVYDLDPARVSRILSALRAELGQPCGLTSARLAAAMRACDRRSERAKISNRQAGQRFAT